MVSLVVLSGVNASRAQDSNPKPLRQFSVSTHFHRSALRNNPQPQWNVDTLVPQIKALGAWAVRDGATWSGVEKVKGQYVLPESDRHWVDVTTAAGLKVVFVLLYDNKLYENPCDPDAFANYAAFMSRTFKDNPNVIAFEIWNEPGNFIMRKQYGGTWNAKDEAPWLKQYGILVDKAAVAIKRENPKVQVVAGAGVAPPMAHLIDRYPQTFKSVDGLVEHPYTYKTPPETVPFGGPKNLERDGISVADEQHTMRSLLNGESDRVEQKTGRRLPVWVTEFGFGTFTKQRKPGLYAGYTDAAQAAYHTRALIQGLASGVALWSVYDLVDDGLDVSDPEHNFGIIRHDGRPKPAYDALRRVAQQLGSEWESLGSAPDTLQVDFDPKVVGDKNPWAGPNADPDGVIGPQVYWYKVPGGFVTFVWNAGRLNAEHRPPVGALTFKQNGTATAAEWTNLCTGEKATLKLTGSGDATVAGGVPVGGEPIAVKWTVK